MIEPAQTGPEARAFFEEHGWTVLREVWVGDALAELAVLFERVLEPWLAAAPVASGEDPIWQLPGASRQHPALLAHLRGALGARVAGLLGAARLQLLQDTLIVKPPDRGAAVDLHQDYTYTGFLEPSRAVSVRLSLSGEQSHEGCLWVVDGSHRWGAQGAYAPFTDRLSEVAVEQLPEELRARINADRRPLELEPGDVSVHHCLTFHGSYENRGAKARKTLVTHVFDAGCRLVPERLPAGAREYFEVDAEGHLVGPGFPIVFGPSDGHSNPMTNV